MTLLMRRLKVLSQTVEAHGPLAATLHRVIQPSGAFAAFPRLRRRSFLAPATGSVPDSQGRDQR